MSDNGQPIESGNGKPERKQVILRDSTNGKWLKGSCTNPKGRPKGVRNTVTVLMENLDRPARDFAATAKLAEKHGLPPDATVMQVCAIGWAVAAALGKPTPLQALLDRTCGKLADRIEPTGPLEIVIRHEHVTVAPRLVESEEVA